MRAVPSWDDYYMGIAEAASARSKDPSTNVGAVLVQGTTLTTGYNGFPKGVRDLPERWGKRPDKYEYVLHAEENAILNAKFDTNGATMYITHFPPCNHCCKMMIQAGIKRIVCGKRRLNANTHCLSKEGLTMLEEAGVELVVAVES